MRDGVLVQDQAPVVAPPVDAPPDGAQRRSTVVTFVVPILAVYLVSRLIVFGALLDAYGRNWTLTKFAGIWDGKYYLQIAAHGYPTALTHHGSAVAYFPLYPLLVRGATSIIGGNGAIAGLVVSFFTGAAACLAVGALARERAGDETGVRAGWLVAVAPGAAFLSPAYAEGLAISLCAAGLIMLDRRRWLAAGLIGAIATAASPLAITLVVAAAWAAWRSGQRRAAVAPVLGSSGVVLYFLYLWVHMGTPFGWFDAERLGWGHHVNLFAPLHWLTMWSGVTLVETVCLVAAFVGLWAMRTARVPGTWWVFTLPFLASVVFDGRLWLTPRLLLSAFPLVPAVAMVVHGKGLRILVASSAIVMVVVLVAYTGLSGFFFEP